MVAWCFVNMVIFLSVFSLMLANIILEFGIRVVVVAVEIVICEVWGIGVVSC